MRALTRMSTVPWLALALMPSRVYGQASITGTVRDTSGAVLPGVTVEAASDVLIEKSRTALTDGNGFGSSIFDRAPTSSRSRFLDSTPFGETVSR